MTALEALDIVGSFRLAARVADLRAMGYKIRAERATTKSGAVIAKYILERSKETPE